MIVTAASQDASYDPVATDDLAGWASYFGLDFPILADPAAATDRLYDPSGRTRPTYVLLAPGLEIVKLASEPSEAEIEAILPTSYP